MSIETRQSHYIVKDKEVIVSNQEIIGKKWKFDGIFKVISYIFYGIFFGMLSAIFKFAGPGSLLNAKVENEVVIFSTIALFLMSIISIGIIHWVFKRDVKEFMPLTYSIVQLINALYLSLGLIIVTIIYKSPNTLNQLIDRQNIIMIYYGIWPVFMSIILFALLIRIKKQYPLSWTKIPFAIFTWLIMLVVQIMFYLAQQNASSNEQKVLFIVSGAIVLLLTSFVFLFSIIWIKRFRDTLLLGRTELEIETINNWEEMKKMSIISSFVAGITFLVAFMWNDLKLSDFTNGIFFIDLIVNAILFVSYLVMIIYVKTLNVNNKKKMFKVSKFFKSIDNNLLLEMIVWFILVKTTLIQGIFINEEVIKWLPVFSLLTISSFATVILLYVVTIVASLNIPNLKNTMSSAFVMIFSTLLIVYTILFNTALGDSMISFDSLWLTFIMILLPLIGISILLIIKIVSISKIFKLNENPLKLAKSNVQNESVEVKGGNNE